ncbi:MAG: sigma-70 family RNA polymerase sigma factor [Cyclobacteriaceae bacterium]
MSKRLDHTDDHLLENYRKGQNSEDFSVVFSRYQHLVYGTCLKYLKNRDEAQDALMSIFEKLFEKLKTEEVTYFKSWLYMVTKNHCLMQLRKSNLEIPSDLMEITLPVHPIDEPDDLEQNLTALEECLETLKKDQEECVRLFYLEKKSYQEVSETTSFELKAVKSFIQNGKRNLKICLEGKNVKG